MPTSSILEMFDEVAEKVARGEVVSAFVVYMGSDNVPLYSQEGPHDVLTMLGAVSVCLRDYESQEFSFD